MLFYFLPFPYTLLVVINDKKCQLFVFSVVLETTCRERERERATEQHTHTHTCDVTSTLPCQGKVLLFNIVTGQGGLLSPAVFTSLSTENKIQEI